MDVTVEEARALVSDKALWPRVRDFLWDFAPQVHPSWTEGLDALDHLESPRVKRYILDSLGVEPCFHTFPKDDWSRLLLLDGATIESVAKWLGAIFSVDALRHVTDGAAVRGLKAALPGIYPEVFGYTMYFGDVVQRKDVETQSLQTGVVEEGFSLLLSVLSDLPAPLIARLKFKLPKGLCASASRREIKHSTVSKLLKLKFPEAYSLCCS